jgi:hypothetical protein
MSPRMEIVDVHLEVTRVIAHGADEWAVLLAVGEDGRTHKLVGKPLGRYAEPGRPLRVRGRWSQDPEHGRELLVTAASADLTVAPCAPEVEALLKRVPHLGDKRAQLLIDHFGPDAVVERIDESAQHAFMKVAGMPHLHAGEASRWWHEHRGGAAGRGPAA